MTECVGLECIWPACRCRREVGKSGMAKLFAEYAVTKVAEQQLREAGWRFRQHMTGGNRGTFVFYDEVNPAPDWLFEAPSVDRVLPGIAPAPTVESALVCHPDGSVWAVPWRGASFEKPKVFTKWPFFSPAFTPDPACWERRVLGHWDESEGA